MVGRQPTMKQEARMSGVGCGFSMDITSNNPNKKHRKNKVEEEEKIKKYQKSDEEEYMRVAVGSPKYDTRGEKVFCRERAVGCEAHFILHK